jgi:hypothetical protein
MGAPAQSHDDPGTHESVEHACGIDRSQLFSDEAPPIGAVAAEHWPEQASVLAAWLLRWN